MPLRRQESNVDEEENYLSSLFHFETNMEQMASSAMNPVINNRTLIDLYYEAYVITNATGADSVLLELDPITGANNSIMVMAVTRPNVPTHEDLLKQFNLYFVNFTETNSPMDSDSMPQSINYEEPTIWQIFVDLIRNQANAIIGALMIPINVSSQAILKSTQTHSEYVMTGSSFGSVISAPVILKAISIPNIVSQRITDMTSHQINNIEMIGQEAKTLTDHGIQSIAYGINNSTHFVSSAADQYVIRPIGAFTGFNLDRAGTHLADIGQSFANTGMNLHLLGERLGNGATRVVSAGATAIAWGLDDSVTFNKNKNNSAIATK